MPKVQKITFKDRGQEFVEWYIRKDIVIDCQPWEGRFWVGTRIEYPSGALKVGGKIHYHSVSNGKVLSLDCPIKSIEELDSDEASVVEYCGRKWAEVQGREPTELGLDAWIATKEVM